MKRFTQTTLIALLIGTFAFAQKGTPGNQVAPSQTTVMVGASRGSVTLLSPADGKSIAASDASKPVLFRWTALVPKPKEAVTYRLKVWQLMQGQNGTEAMRSNQPVITKDVVNITQAAISNLYTGPCKPPYLCDFVWSVEVLNSEGFSITNNATNNAYTFKYEGNKGNAGNTGMSTGKSLGAQGDPVHGVDVELGTKSLRDQQTAYALYVPVEKIIYDTDGNVTGVMIKNDKGESGFVKVLVAGSKSISGGCVMLKTEKGEPATAKIVVTGSNSLSGGVK